MADAGLHVVLLAVGTQAGAQVVGRHRLAQRADVVAFAFVGLSLWTFHQIFSALWFGHIHTLAIKHSARFIRFEGDDLLHIDSPPMPHPNVNNKIVRVIVTWARDK